MRVLSKISINSGASIMPSNMQIDVGPFLLIPNVELSWMFWTWLKTWLLSFFSIAKSLVRFHLHCCLITPDDIVEVVMQVSLSKQQSLCSITQSLYRSNLADFNYELLLQEIHKSH